MEEEVWFDPQQSPAAAIAEALRDGLPDGLHVVVGGEIGIAADPTYGVVGGSCAGDPNCLGYAFVQGTSPEVMTTIAHELGHLLISSAHQDHLPSNLMKDKAWTTLLTDQQCGVARSTARDFAL
jgi:hypothetical protein